MQIFTHNNEIVSNHLIARIYETQIKHQLLIFHQPLNNYYAALMDYYNNFHYFHVSVDQPTQKYALSYTNFEALPWKLLKWNTHYRSRVDIFSAQGGLLI